MTTDQNPPASESIKILACQIDIPPTDCVATRNKHLQSAASRVTQAAASADIQLIVLPELSSIDYSRASFENLAALAEPLDGPSAECWGKVAQDTHSYVAYGFPRTGPDGFYICIAVVDPSGNLVGHYDKMHLAQYGASMEKEYFQRGAHPFTFTINGIRLAPIICYDIRFPELCRSLTVNHDVSVILHCGAYYRDESFSTWHDFVRTRAVENQLYILSLNRAGEHFGNSVFCPPWIDNTTTTTNFEYHCEDIKTVVVSKKQINLARDTYSFLQDRQNSYR